MEIGLNDAYSVKTPEDNRKLYAKWADTYESDFVVTQGYEHPRIIAEYFHSELSSTENEIQTVIDIGTGTGLVGRYLSVLKPGIVLDGIDISPEMLAEAKKKNVYRNLYERDLSKSILETAAPYDALITIGTFTHGHLGKDALLNILPLVRSDGYFVIGFNASYFTEQGFQELLSDLEREKVITITSLQESAVYKEDSPHHGSLNVLVVFKKS